MAKLPEFLLRALYVKGSLRSHEGGFAFEMKNELGPARIVGVEPLQVNRRPVPLAQCRFLHGGEVMDFSAVSADNSVLMRKGEAVTVEVADHPLPAGRQTLGIRVIVKDMGPVRFSISDQVR